MTDEVPAEVADAPSEHAGKRRRWWVLGAVALLVVVAAGAAVWVRSSGSAGSSGSADAPRFVDVTATSGVSHAYTGDFEFFVGGGVATFDCDGNGMPDLYLAGGTSPAALYRNTGTVGGALAFEQVPSPVTDLTSVTGAYPLDVDGDGITDLVVLRNTAGNQVLRGLGSCAFEDATASLGIDPGKAWTVGFSAAWEGDAALPTLAFGNYLVPDTYDCDTSVMVRPASATAYGEPIPLAPGHCALSVLFSDWDRSGRKDLRVTNDRHYYREGGEQLWKVVPGEDPVLYTEADGWRPLQLFGMGLASQDLDGDGYPEVVITNQGDNKLQTLDPPGDRPTYKDIALALGTLAQRPYTGGDILPSTAWHAEFQDVNNDGRIDLFLSKGNVSAQPDFASKDPNNLLLRQPDGTFREAGEEAGIATFTPSRGAAVTDLNLDGLPDLVVVHRQEPVTIWRNVGAGTADAPEPMGHWIGVRLQQPAPNVDAVGAFLDVRVGEEVVSRELTVGGGHASGELGFVHAGLGDATSADVRVRWPDGEVGEWITVTADQLVTIERGATTATPFQPTP